MNTNALPKFKNAAAGYIRSEINIKSTVYYWFSNATWDTDRLNDSQANSWLVDSDMTGKATAATGNDELA